MVKQVITFNLHLNLQQFLRNQLQKLIIFIFRRRPADGHYLFFKIGVGEAIFSPIQYQNTKYQKDDKNDVLQCENTCTNIIHSKSFDDGKFITFHKILRDVETICPTSLTYHNLDDVISEICHDAILTTNCPAFSEEWQYDHWCDILGKEEQFSFSWFFLFRLNFHLLIHQLKVNGYCIGIVIIIILRLYTLRHWKVDYLRYQQLVKPKLNLYK